MLPDYINEYLKAYFEMSSEDRRKILDDRYFDTNPLTCPIEYLPYLAIEIGVDINGLSEKEARVAIDEAINALNYKATAKSFKSSLKPFTDAEVKEWYEYEGEPYYFKAVLSPNNLDFSFDENNFSKLERVIEENKNVRSLLDGFEIAIYLEERVNSFAGVVLKTGIDKDLKIDLEPNEKILINEANIFYLNINKYLKKDLVPTDNTTIQGAVIWQV